MLLVENLALIFKHQDYLFELEKFFVFIALLVTLIWNLYFCFFLWRFVLFFTRIALIRRNMFEVRLLYDSTRSQLWHHWNNRFLLSIYNLALSTSVLDAFWVDWVIKCGKYVERSHFKFLKYSIIKFWPRFKPLNRVIS